MMQLFKRLTACAILLPWLVAMSFHAHSAEAPDNKQKVAHAFEQWQRGVGSPFDLLTDDATWTINGPTPSAGTYQRDELTEKVLKPFNAQLKTPLTPRVKQIYEDGDTVIILFDASATLKNDAPYENSYAWFFTMKEGRVVSVTAVLDLHAFDKVMAFKE